MIEDEPPQRALIRRRLTLVRFDFEFELVEATNGREAQAMVIDGQKFDLIISDAKMPEMSGEEFYRWLDREGRQTMPFIFFAGQPITVDGSYTFVMKPSLITLGECVYALLT